MSHTKIKQLLATSAATLALVLGMGGAVVSASKQNVTCPSGSHLQGNNCKVEICHRTNSVTNPYTRPDVDVSSVDGNGGNDNGQGDHLLEHTGPAFDVNATYPTPHNGDQWGDIIPPVTGVETGLNWDAAGQATYNNGCTPVAVTTTNPGTPVTTTTPGSVLGATTQTQVGTVPAGAVNAGAGGGAFRYSVASIVGLVSSVAILAGSAVVFARGKLL